MIAATSRRACNISGYFWPHSTEWTTPPLNDSQVPDLECYPSDISEGGDHTTSMVSIICFRGGADA